MYFSKMLKKNIENLPTLTILNMLKPFYCQKWYIKKKTNSGLKEKK